MVACCACVGAVKLSPVNATATKTGSLIANIMRTLLFGGLHVKDSRKCNCAMHTEIQVTLIRWKFASRCVPRRKRARHNGGRDSSEPQSPSPVLRTIHLEVTCRTATPSDDRHAVSYPSAKPVFSQRLVSRKTWIIGGSSARHVAACAWRNRGIPRRLSPLCGLRGTIDQVNGNTLTIKTRSGADHSPTKDGSPVIAHREGRCPTSRTTHLSACVLAQPDGTIKAVEVHVFAEPL